MAKPGDYVHVMDNETNLSTHVVGPCSNAEKTERGMERNLEHAKYYTKISPCGHAVADPVLCIVCVGGDRK